MVNTSDAGAFHHLEARRLARALSARGGRQIFRRAITIRTALCADYARLAVLIGYNTNLVKTEDAPKSFADLLDPKWKGKIVKAHPGLQRHHHDRDVPDRARSRLGAISRSWRGRTSCRCSRQPIRPRARARRARHDGRRQRVQSVSSARRRASRSTIVYPTEGTPLIIGPSAVMSRLRPIRMPRGCSRTACIRAEGQQLLVDYGAPAFAASQTVKEKPGVANRSRDQADEGRPRRRRKRREEIKTPLHAVLQGVTCILGGRAGRRANPLARSLSCIPRRAGETPRVRL